MRQFSRCAVLLGTCLFAAPIIKAYDQVQVGKTVPLMAKKSSPSVLRLDPEKNLWILDSSNLTIQKVNTQGKAENVIKPGKKRDGLFKEPVDFGFAKDGTLIVLDLGFDRIVFITKGKKTNEIIVEKPAGLAVSQDDVIAVGNMGLKTVRIYSRDGVLLHDLYPPANEPFKSISALAFGRDGTLFALDGDAGKLHRFSSERKWVGVTSELGSSQGLAVGDNGFSYVTLREGRWKEINKEGKVLSTFGTKGKTAGQLSNPVGVVLMDASHLWVSEQGNNRLQLFEITNNNLERPLISQPSARLQVRKRETKQADYKFVFIRRDGSLALIDRKGAGVTLADKSGTATQTIAMKSHKKEPGIYEPMSVSEDREGALWVADQDKLKKVSEKGEILQTMGEKGKKEGNISDLTQLYMRPDNSFVVVDKGGSRVQVLSPKGLFLFKVGSEGKKPGQFGEVTAIAVSPDNIVIMDNDKKSLLFYDNNGKYLMEIANKPDTAPIWKDISGISVDGAGRFYVMDKGFNRVRIFDLKGMFIGDFEAQGEHIACGPDQTILILGNRLMQWYTVDIMPFAIEKVKAEDDGGNIKLTWAANADSMNYRIYKSSADNPNFYLVYSTNILQMYDSDLVPGTMYRYAVTGVNAMGYEGNWVPTESIKASKRKDTSLISISSVNFDPIFTAAFKTYVKQPIGTIKIKNNDEKAFRDVKISFSLRKYTDYATEIPVKLIEAGQELTLPVTMNFNDNVLELTENTPVQTDVRVLYFEDNAEKVVSQNAPLTLYSRNAISWTDSARISSFITPRDVPVVDFSRAAIKNFIVPLKTTTLPKPIAKGALIFQSLEALNMSYVPDPKTPFAEVSGKPEILDYVQYPRETLRRKIGDCDDTSALYASLLESIGVEAALVETPGHIFVMVNTEESDPDAIGFPIERFVEYKGTYWMPVETTKLGKGFPAAWQAGIAQVKAGQDSKKIKFTTVLEASQKYPPITLVEKETEPTLYPVEAVQASFLPQLNKAQEELYQTRLAAVESQISKTPGDAMLQIQLGMVHVEGGKQDLGRKIFESMVKNDSLDVQAAAQNNLGNLDYLKGDYPGAAQHYADAAIFAPDDGGIMINRGRTAWKMGDRAGTQKYIGEAREILPDWREYVTDIPAEYLPN